MIVANKFQTGFDQPLLAGMFLDKPVVDRNAVQTVSRLNRCHEGKKDVVVVDFTNNAKAILKAFAEIPQRHAVRAGRAGPGALPEALRRDSGGGGVHAEGCRRFRETARDRHRCAGAVLRSTRCAPAFRQRSRTLEERKAFVYLLARFVKSFHFLTCFFTYAPELKEFATFAEYVGPQLIKQGSVSDLMKQIRQTEVIKAAVEYQGVTTSGGPVKLKPGKGKKGYWPAAQESLRSGHD